MRALIALVAGIISTCPPHQAYAGRHHKRARNILWFTPSKTNKINGLAIGLIARRIPGCEL